MTPSFLQDALVNALKGLFFGKRYQNSQGKLVPLQLFAQNVPMSKYGANGDDCFPYLLVSIEEWSQDGPTDQVTCKAVILAGIFDDDEGLQGHKDLLNILEDIMLLIRQSGIIQKKYRMQYPVKAVLNDEDTYPYFFGAIECSWELMNVYGNEGEAKNI